MDDDLKLVEEIDHEMAGREPGFADVRGELLFRCAATITRLHAEITQRDNTIDDLEFLNAKLVKERDEALADNAKLRMMIEALQKAERWFRAYEKSHRDKGTPDGRLKANLNRDRADVMAKAIAKAGDVAFNPPAFFVMEEALRAIANEYPPDGDGPEQGPAHLWAWAQARAAAALSPAQAEIDAIARAEKAEAQRDAALEALRPFAVWAQKMPAGVAPKFGYEIANILGRAAVNGYLTGEHFRAASRTLEGE